MAGLPRAVPLSFRLPLPAHLAVPFSACDRLGGHDLADHARRSGRTGAYRPAPRRTQKPLIVHSLAKPLNDTVRGIQIGDFPAAPVRVNAKTGRLEYVKASQ